MKAYRGHGNSFIEIEVDIDPITNEPILPLNSTVTPPPTPGDGMYVTLVNGVWVEEKEVDYSTPDLETMKRDKLDQLETWKELYLNAPFCYEGIVFHGDQTAREMINSSILALREYDQLPPQWVTYDGNVITQIDEKMIRGMGKVIHEQYSKRFTEVVQLTGAIASAGTIESLLEIPFPEPATPETLIEEFNHVLAEQGIQEKDVEEVQDGPTQEEMDLEYLQFLKENGRLNDIIENKPVGDKEDVTTPEEPEVDSTVVDDPESEVVPEEESEQVE